eukprot:GEZU01018253.1.p1 GENE.GEZU01018253.1~~GEZU01018253.1.p1  ORF type:complete len:299 (+),score=78.92 GEZU01018253.1:45-899(+)
MVFYVIGLGLGDEKDITVKGLETVRSCSRIYLEAYTSILGVDKERLEAFYGKQITLADREMVESNSDEILANAGTENVAFLVVGDPFGATTHSDIIVRARDLGIKVEVLHNASIMNACGVSGLQLYRFGQTISMVFFTETWRPDSWYDKVKQNRAIGLHTLCLLDIKVKEQSIENMMRGRKIYEPPRYMTVNQAIEQLIEIEDKRKEGAYSRDTMCVGLARVGQPTQTIIAGPMEKLLKADFGAPLHSLIICGELHEFELEYIKAYMIKDDDTEATTTTNNNEK